MKMQNLFLSSVIVLLSACSTSAPVDPNADKAQVAITSTTNAYKGLDAAIKATDAALVSGAIKSADADKALKAFTVSKIGLDAALSTLRGAVAVSGAASAASATSGVQK